eukprot:scaffold1253_cov245-Pinguiococcus_pyrenoidosus.AAC.25
MEDPRRVQDDGCAQAVGIVMQQQADQPAEGRHVRVGSRPILQVKDDHPGVAPRGGMSVLLGRHLPHAVLHRADFPLRTANEDDGTPDPVRPSFGTGRHRFFRSRPSTAAAGFESSSAERLARHSKSRASWRADDSMSGERAWTKRTRSLDLSFFSSSRYLNGMPKASVSSCSAFRELLSGVSRSESPSACIMMFRTASTVHVSGVIMRSTFSQSMRSLGGRPAIHAAWSKP